MTTLRMITMLVCTTSIIGLGIYDLIMVVIGFIKGTNIQTSVSRFMQRVGFSSPMFVFAVGFVCGHLFGYMNPEMVKSAHATNTVMQNVTIKSEGTLNFSDMMSGNPGETDVIVQGGTFRNLILRHSDESQTKYVYQNKKLVEVK